MGHGRRAGAGPGTGAATDSGQLTVLPEWIGQLTALESLDLSDNQLTALPESIGQLTTLKPPDLDGNPLSEP